MMFEIFPLLNYELLLFCEMINDDYA